MEVRGVTRESLAGYRQSVQKNIEDPRRAGDGGDYQAHQCFIALGQFMTAAALLGVDTCALGGIDRAQCNEILGINGTPYTTVVSDRSGTYGRGVAG